MKRVIVVLTVVVFSIPAISQVIQIKTVPVATGSQFLLFPSNNLGMGGVTIAVDDNALDPFINPAKGVRLSRIHIYSAPMYYSVSHEVSNAGGTGKTLPMSVLFRSNSYFGGLSWARQKLVDDKGDSFGVQPGVSTVTGSTTSPQQERSNSYTFGTIGVELFPGLAVGFSAHWSDLGAIEGVQLLYQGNSNLRQTGSSADYRIGILGTLSDDESIEAVLVRNEFEMRHEVTYQTWGGPWDDPRPFPPLGSPIEVNEDKTELWGVHVGYMRPFVDQWRVGLQLTANWKQHPKIPNYRLMNIPRDPGNSQAFNYGIGFARTIDESVVGIDFIYQPITLNTWAEWEPSGVPDETNIPQNGKSVENFFRFHNFIGRVGLRAENDRNIFALGVQTTSIGYRMRQLNNVIGSVRTQKERWLETTLSAALGLKFTDVQLRYTGLVQFGTGTPGVASVPRLFTRGGSFDALSADFLPAPSGPLDLREALVFTHQILISFQLF